MKGNEGWDMGDHVVPEFTNASHPATILSQQLLDEEATRCFEGHSNTVAMDNNASVGNTVQYQKSLTTAAISDDGSAACLLCCPMGDKGVKEDSVGKVGRAFVVNLLWRLARSWRVVVEEAACEPIGRLYVGKDDSFWGDLRPLVKAILNN
jgi:hypothetical protein